MFNRSLGLVYLQKEFRLFEDSLHLPSEELIGFHEFSDFRFSLLGEVNPRMRRERFGKCMLVSEELHRNKQESEQGANEKNSGHSNKWEKNGFRRVPNSQRV